MRKCKTLETARREILRISQDMQQKAAIFNALGKSAGGAVDGADDGVRRYQLLWSNIARIEQTYLTLSKQQRHIIEEFARASLVKIVGIENYEKNPMFYMKMAQKKNRQSLSIVITPRRFGKTTATAIYVAALLLTVPSIVIAIFSTGRRASTLLLQKISQIVLGTQQDKRVLQSNQETLKIGGESPGETRTCHSYPSNVATLKGVGCDIGIMEEFTRCDPAVWQEVVIPLLGVNGTSIVAISTPLGEDNWYSDLIQKRRDDGTQLFNVIQYSLVCAECRRKGISSQCAHRMDLLPPWKSEGRQKLVKFLLGNSEDMFLTEAMGEISSSKSRCFSEELIDAFLLRPQNHLPTMHKSQTVFICIDPTSGVRSELAIASLFFTSNNSLCVSIGANPVHDTRQNPSLVARGLPAPVEIVEHPLRHKAVHVGVRLGLRGRQPRVQRREAQNNPKLGRTPKLVDLVRFHPQQILKILEVQIIFMPCFFKESLVAAQQKRV